MTITIMGCVIFSLDICQFDLFNTDLVPHQWNSSLFWTSNHCDHPKCSNATAGNTRPTNFHQRQNCKWWLKTYWCNSGYCNSRPQFLHQHYLRTRPKSPPCTLQHGKCFYLSAPQALPMHCNDVYLCCTMFMSASQAPTAYPQQPYAFPPPQPQYPPYGPPQPTQQVQIWYKCDI